MGKGKRYGKGMMATNQEGEREQFLHWCINTRLLFQHSFRKVLLKRKLPSARRERRASESSYVPFSLSRVSSNKGYGCSQRGREGRDAGFPQIEEGGQGFFESPPRARADMASAGTLDVVALDAAVCGVWSSVVS